MVVIVVVQVLQVYGLFHCTGQQNLGGPTIPIILGRCCILMNSTKHCSCLKAQLVLPHSEFLLVMLDSGHRPHVMKIGCYPENRKYIRTYHNTIGGESSHGHRQHAQKFGEVRPL